MSPQARNKCYELRLTINHIVVVNISVSKGATSNSITTYSDGRNRPYLIENLKEHALGHITAHKVRSGARMV